MRSFTMLVALSAVALLAGCASSPSAPKDQRSSVAGSAPTAMIEVQLGIYSGRPDPVWSLTEAQSAHLMELLTGLPRVRRTPIDGGLGYHGFTITSATGFGNLTPGSRLLILRGDVAAPGAGQSIARDPDRSIERFLLDTGRDRLSAVGVAEVEQDFARQPNASGPSE